MLLGVACLVGQSVVNVSRMFKAKWVSMTTESYSLSSLLICLWWLLRNASLNCSSLIYRTVRNQLVKPATVGTDWNLTGRDNNTGYYVCV